MVVSPSSDRGTLPPNPGPSRFQAFRAQLRAHPLLGFTVLLLCPLLIGGVGSFIIYPQARAAYHWRQAQQALEEQHFQAALGHLAVCLEVWPSSGATHFLMGRTCRRAGDLEGARAHLNEARRCHWSPALLDLEDLLLQAQVGMVRPVEATLRRYMANYPDQEKVILEALIHGDLQSNYLEAAHNWAALWTEHYPDDGQGWFWRGYALERGLRYDLAAEEYQRALERRPQHADTHLRLAEVLLWKGRFDEALAHFGVYLAKDPEHATSLLGRARCQRSLGQLDAARATLEQLDAFQLEPPGALLLRGELELDADHAEEAVVWLRRAQAQTPQDREANQMLATALRRLMRVEEAEVYERNKKRIEADLRRMDELTREVVSHPDDVARRYEAGTILLRLGQETQALSWLVSAFLLDREHEPTKKALADCLQKLGDPKLLAYYRQVLGGG